MSNGRFEKGVTPWNKGKTGYHIHSEEHKLGLAEKMKGNKSRTGQKKPVSEILKRKETFMKRYGTMMPAEMKTKIVAGLIGSKRLVGYKQTPEHVRNALRRHEKSSLEIKFENIVNELKLPYIFVGNGEFLIGRKCPDFVNTNGEKIAVEVYCKKHKDLFRGGVEQWKSDREQLFSNYGYKTVFFDALEVDRDTILSRLTRDGD